MKSQIYKVITHIESNNNSFRLYAFSMYKQYIRNPGCILVHYYSRNENIPIIPTLTLSPDEEAIIVLRSGQPTKQVICIIIKVMCCVSALIGYEPADLTVHPPPQNDRGWVYFFCIGV